MRIKTPRSEECPVFFHHDFAGIVCEVVHRWGLIVKHVHTFPNTAAGVLSLDHQFSAPFCPLRHCVTSFRVIHCNDHPGPSGEE